MQLNYNILHINKTAIYNFIHAIPVTKYHDNILLNINDQAQHLAFSMLSKSQADHFH